MRRHTRVRPEFWDDLLAASEYYNSKIPGLGDEFADDVVIHVRRAAEAPEAFPVFASPTAVCFYAALVSSLFMPPRLTVCFLSASCTVPATSGAG
jgi:hypothetical protein